VAVDHGQSPDLVAGHSLQDGSVALVDW
jgi:hypothetical protein